MVAERLCFYQAECNGDSRYWYIFFELYRRHAEGKTLTYGDVWDFHIFRNHEEIERCLQWAEGNGYLTRHPNGIVTEEIFRPAKRFFPFVEKRLDIEVNSWRKALA
jgi:hypothetical protein